MKSSAKFTATFLAAAALGTIAYVTGCTVTSGTVDDTDGGTSSNTDSGTSNSDTGTGTNADTGTGTKTCNSGGEGTFLNATCQACLDEKCCAEQTACYAIKGDDAAGKVGCNDYDKCISNCTDTGGQQTCYDGCDTTAQTGVKDAYDAIVSCGETKCASACGGLDPDAGADGG